MDNVSVSDLLNNIAQENVEDEDNIEMMNEVEVELEDLGMEDDSDVGAEIDFSEEDSTEMVDVSSSSTAPPTTTIRRSARRLNREVENLAFVNPGDRLSIPDTSAIISKTRAKRNVKSTYDERADDECPLTHDRTGKLITRDKTTGESISVDLCDCLDLECGGCQWPCKTCKSRKCCPRVCRQNRKEILTMTEAMYTPEGTTGHAIRYNPFLPKQ